MRPKPSARLPLTALRTFEAAARRLSFKDAAEELCVTPATVSNQVRRLERDWGRPLFVRHTRRIELTEEGRALAAVLGRAFAEIRAEIDARFAPAAPTITLAVGPIFGARWLSPRLGRFRQRHPGIALSLRHGPRIASAAEMSSDVAIDWGIAWPGLETTRLFGIVYAPVASPALIAACGGLERPRDLTRFPVIHQHDRSEWRNWLALAGAPDLAFAEETVVTDSNLVTQAALDGQCVALGIFPFVAAEVAAGRLVRPFAVDLHPERAYHLLSRPGARRDPDIAALCAWIEAEAASGP